jgi:hypothetical protein
MNWIRPYCLWVLLIFATGIGTVPTCSQEITYLPSVEGYCSITIGGEITSDLAQRLELTLTKIKRDNCDFSKEGLDVSLVSPGGSLTGAIEAGRLLRKYRSRTRLLISGCASACVLLFLGGAERSVEWGKIGLHRPFFATPSGTPLDAELRYKSSSSLVANYLQELNIPARLLDEMNMVPSGQIKWLKGTEDRAELKSLFIDGTDPVYQTELDSKMARRLDISLADFYQRQQRIPMECGDKPSASKLELRNKYDICRRVILNGRSVQKIFD